MHQPEKRLRGIRLRKFSEPFQSARYRGAISIFTYVCGTMEVHKQSTPEVLSMSRRCITYEHGTPAI